MKRPPPLGRIFAAYFRILLLAAIEFTAFAAIALTRGWPLPTLVDSLTHEQLPH